MQKFVYSQLDSSKFVLSIFIDFAKAFDCVSHNILLSKMRYYGIRGQVLKWFSSYLADRTQSIRVDDQESDKGYIPHGVPQGSVLGPVLFLIYVADLPNSSDFFKYILFADDSTLYVGGDSPIHLVESANVELPKLYYWCTANRLTLNICKTHYMIFSNKPVRVPLPPLTIKYGFDYRIITQVPFLKFLGVIFDQQLTFQYHTNHLTNKLSQLNAMFYKIRQLLPFTIKRTLYFAHVNSVISYCINIWGGTNEVHLKSLKIAQKRIIRTLNNSGFIDHTAPLFKSSKILNLNDLYKHKIALDHYKLNQHTRIQPVPRHTYFTRNRHLAPPDRHRRSIYERHYSYMGPKVFNQLPLRLKNILTIISFKHQLKQYFLSQY